VNTEAPKHEPASRRQKAVVSDLMMISVARNRA
jgi:hypothetical protein